MTTKELRANAANSASPRHASMPDDLLNELEVAAILKLAPGTLRNWRSLGINIAFARIGKRAIRYRRSDVDAFLANGMSNVEAA